jgi:3-deoxy-D-manno-octulosonic-acid transferase
MNIPHPVHKEKSITVTDCMYGVYNIFFIGAFILASPLLLLRMLWSGKYRRSFKERLGLKVNNCWSGKENPRPIWIHALSVGETLSAVSLVKALAKRYPKIPIIFSTSTETGQQTALKAMGGLVADTFYFPLDLIFIVRKILEKIRPCLFVLIETDIWPNFLGELKTRSFPAVLVNGRMSANSFKRYRHFRFFIKRVLFCFQAIGMQDPIYARRMVELGAPEDKVFVGGNLKFDQEHRFVEQPERDEMLFSLGWNNPSKRVLVAGSTHEGEEEIIFAAFSRLLQDFPDGALIVAPRNPERFGKVYNLALAMGLRCRKLSDPVDPADQVVVADRIGELSRLYVVGEAVFVGGSLVREGGHNLLEPAAQKKPVVFGPHMDDFQEMADLIVEAGGGVVVSNQNELYQAWRSLLDSHLLAERTGEIAYEVWRNNRGALQNYLCCLDRYLN